MKPCPGGAGDANGPARTTAEVCGGPAGLWARAANSERAGLGGVIGHCGLAADDAELAADGFRPVRPCWKECMGHTHCRYQQPASMDESSIGTHGAPFVFQ